MPIKISPASESAIAQFNKRTWRQSNKEHYGPGARWKSKLFVLQAKENGRIVGTLKAQYDAGVVYVKQLIVSKDKRRLGAGRKLMAELVKRAKPLGAHKLFLFTGQGWSACKFYEKLGFKKAGKLPRHYLKREFVIYSKLI